MRVQEAQDEMDRGLETQCKCLESPLERYGFIASLVKLIGLATASSQVLRPMQKSCQRTEFQSQA